MPFTQKTQSHKQLNSELHCAAKKKKKKSIWQNA